MNNYEFDECKDCGCTKPYCGLCPYRYCETKEDCDFVTDLCEQLREKTINDRQFTIRYKKHFGVADNV